MAMQLGWLWPALAAAHDAHWLSAAGRGLTPIARENARVGTADWLLRNPALDGEIQGYASRTSVARGEEIAFLVDTTAARFRLEIFRVGYYRGLGARHMLTVDRVPGGRQSAGCRGPDGLIDCRWRPSAHLKVPRSWTSGVYLARLTMLGPVARDSYILFVVRDDRRPADFVAMIPVATYQAYNRWGGASLYEGCSDGVRLRCDVSRRADRVSFNRPYGPSRSPAARFGVGAGEFLTNVQTVDDDYPISSAGFDINLVRWVERQGYDVTYATSLDLHHQPEILSGTRAFLSTGHDEYYSHAMWSALHTGLDHGLNLGFFSSNQIYWQVRFEASAVPSDERDRIMICYRLGGDPVVDDRLTTGRFRDLARPEAEMIGNQYVFDPVESYVSIVDPGHWLLAGTGATRGMRFDGLLGYEVNAVNAAASPANVQVLAHTDNGDWSSDVTYYVRTSGAQVFATGTMQWSWGLDDFVSGTTRRRFANPVVQRLTGNVMAMLSERDLVSILSATSGHLLASSVGVDPDPKVGLVATPARPDPGSRFRIVGAADGRWVRIVARGAGLCLTRSPAARTPLWRRCLDGPEEAWRLTRDRRSGVAISSPDRRICLSAPIRGDPADQPNLSPCTGRHHQLWLVKSGDD